METVKCLVKCKGDVTSFLSQNELLDLSEKVLKVSTYIVYYWKLPFPNCLLGSF